jgi:sulfotransferase family protein
MSRSPEFIIVGAQKAGTTWLANMLQQHREIYVPDPIETHFFDVQENFNKGDQWYQSLFEGSHEGQVVGEKTPDYFWTQRGTDFHKDMPQRIFKTTPKCKLIFVLRNPVARAISAINHHVMHGRLSPFLDVEDLLFGKGVEKASTFGILERGFYANELSRYWKVFDRDKCLVLFYEENVVENPEVTLRSVFDFLSVDSEFLPVRSRKKVNSRMRSRQGVVLNYYFPKFQTIVAGLDRLFPQSEPITISSDLLDMLRTYYAPHNHDLEVLLGRKIGCWA